MTEQHRDMTRKQFLFTAGLSLLSLFTAGLMSCGGNKGGDMSAETKIKCADCAMRARYDRNPKSIIGRMWKWHISWCPGWKSYMASLPGDERAKIAAKYK